MEDEVELTVIRPKGLSLAVPCLTVFISSFCIMVLELVATRLIARYLGSSLYTWTGVIGVILAGITIGNYIGGRIADRYAARRTLAILFVLCSIGCVFTVAANNLVGQWTLLYHLSLAMRVFAHVSLVFLPSATLLGMISPVVAKMALDKGLPPGRTVGSIYAWGAAGSIAGTFAAGYYLIAAMGSVEIVWVVAVVLLLLGLVYFFKLWFSHVWMILLVIAMLLGIGPWDWTRQVGAAIALRSKPNENVIYEDETQYCYVAVNRAAGAGNIREFIQDTLMHSRIDMDDITILCYFYEDIFAAVTEKLYPDKQPLSVLVIGGGGYSFPRYIQKVWPLSSVDVVEIDPGVTEAAMAAFGLPRDTTIKTYNMDGRNYVDGLLEEKKQTGEVQRYDIIYEDAINDYSVPFQLTTREFCEKVIQLLNDDGFYIVNLIDVYDDGLFLGAIANTLQQTFPYVTVMTEAGVPRSHRNTFVLVGARHSLGLEDLAEECRRRGMLIWHLTEVTQQI